MNQIDERRVRRLVLDAVSQTPPMPSFELLLAGASSPATTSKEHWQTNRLLTGAAAAALVLAGVGYWNYETSNSDQTIAAGSDPVSSSDAHLELGPFEDLWSSDSWPVLTTVPEGYVAENAVLQEGLRSVFYRNDDTGGVIQIMTGGPNPRSGPFSESVEVMGQQGFIDEMMSGDDDRGIFLTWRADEANFMVSSSMAMPVGQLVALADSLSPVTLETIEGGLDVLDIGMPTSAPLVVAEAIVDGKALSLNAATDDGVVFELGSGSGSGGPYYLEVGSKFAVSLESTGTDAPTVISGLVDQSVAELKLRGAKGNSRSVEIQSRDLGYGVAFFIVELAEGAEALEAVDENGEVLESFDLPDFDARPGLVEVAELLLTPEEFTRDVMGWEDVSFIELPESQGGGVEARQVGAEAAVRFPLSADGRAIYIGPGTDWSLSMSYKPGVVAMQLEALVEEDHWTVLLTRGNGDRLTFQVSASEVDEDWVYLNMPGFDTSERVAGVVLLHDPQDRVLSALSFGPGG